MTVLPEAEDCTMVSSFVWTKHQDVTDRQICCGYYSGLHCKECGHAVKTKYDAQIIKFARMLHTNFTNYRLQIELLTEKNEIFSKMNEDTETCEVVNYWCNNTSVNTMCVLFRQHSISLTHTPAIILQLLHSNDAKINVCCCYWWVQLYNTLQVCTCLLRSAQPLTNVTKQHTLWYYASS